MEHIDQANSRRDFLRKSSCGVCFLAVSLYLAGCDSTSPEEEENNNNNNGGGGNETGIVVASDKITIDLTKPGAAPLASAGGYLFISSASTVTININGTQIRAFTTICTHEGFNMNQVANERIVCSNHGSEFNFSGEVVLGPAALPLKEYPVTRVGDIVTVARI